jgi:dipeptidyl-peptidase-4
MRAAALLLSAVLMIASSPAPAERLTIERLFADPALTGPSPRAVELAPDGSRVTFLKGRDDDQHQLDLWEFKVADGKTRRLVDSRRLLPHEQLSDAEQARRERARTAGLHGIVDYGWSPDSKRLLFPLGDALYVYSLHAAQPDGALKKLADGAVIDPRVSPAGGYVSYVRNQNLYVIELASGVTRQLTRDGGGTIHNAEAEFVAQEEMDQFSGYWWAPDDSAIAFKRYDEAPVPIARRFEIHADRAEVIEQRYPAAGQPNVRLALGLVSPAGGEARWIALGGDSDIYLPRVDWSPDARFLAFQRQSRNQQALDLVRVDAATLAQKLLLTERSSTWINLHDDLRFLATSPGFVWSSERSGYKHLYLYDLDGQLLRPLTTGDWPVDGLLAVDEAAGVLYFDANRDAVIDRQVYRVHLDGSDAGHPQRISQRDGQHKVEFAKSASLYVDSFASPSTPPQVSVHAADGRRLAWIEENRLDGSHPFAPYRDAAVIPEFGHLAAEDGQALYYRMYKPAGFDRTHRYPVMLFFYGGPTAQLVTRGWIDPFSEFMAQQGYVVFTLDNRGMARRGRAFADPIYRRLGEIEVRDQLAGIRWLRQQPFVDARRIGTFGWSYGGYLSLMMLAKASGELAGGVAVAPVTDWSLYDTHYTERYLSTPQANAEGYRHSAVLDALPGLTAPLLLAHGMADDNVLFTNSTQLMAALQQQGTQFQLMTYPGGKHGLSTPAMKTHVYTAIWRFFEERVKGRPAAP